MDGVLFSFGRGEGNLAFFLLKIFDTLADKIKNLTVCGAPLIFCDVVQFMVQFKVIMVVRLI